MTDDPVAAALGAIPVPVLAVDDDEHVTAINPAACKLLGQAAVGRHVVTLIRQPRVLQAITQCLSESRPVETRFITRDHVHETIYRVTCNPVTTGGQGGAVISFLDVTSQETAGQMRRDFVANVSHELRTPLTSLLGFIETLRGPAQDDAAARVRFLATMAREGERMNRLVSDLLSLSRVEEDERVRPTERVELLEVMTHVSRNLAQLAEAAHVTLEIDAGLPQAEVTGDADQLMQVITNLTENAIKYGGEGGRVVLRLSGLRRDPILGRAAICVEVQDFGPGFDEMHIPRLTERFYRIDGHRSRALGGTGLGLAIVKHIINRHKGRLKIESQVGQGSSFTVVLPGE